MTMQTSEDSQSSAALRGLTLIIAVATLMIATRPYSGIWHDATLYTGQALRLLQPENFSADLFFLHSSQDDYTLFTNIYAYIIDLSGVEQAAITLLLIGQVLWLC
jgi:hypothetical protein